MSPAEITAAMLAEDAFSRWLGVEVLAVGFGESRIRFTVRAEMLNGHGTAHGGIAHAVADSGFAFACNSHGAKAVAAETAMSYLRPLHAGDVVECRTRELARGRKLGRYEATLTRDGEAVALFRATCYFKGENWESETKQWGRGPAAE